MNLKKESKNPFIVKIGFGYDECIKKDEVIIGKGCVYYYATENDYNKNNEYSIVDFDFKYNIRKCEIFDVVCDNEDAKYRVEKNEDDFIDNIVCNLLPEMENDGMEVY